MVFMTSCWPRGWPVRSLTLTPSVPKCQCWKVGQPSSWPMSSPANSRPPSTACLVTRPKMRRDNSNRRTACWWCRANGSQEAARIVPLRLAMAHLAAARNSTRTGIERSDGLHPLLKNIFRILKNIVRKPCDTCVARFRRIQIAIFTTTKTGTKLQNIFFSPNLQCHAVIWCQHLYGLLINLFPSIHGKKDFGF